MFAFVPSVFATGAAEANPELDMNIFWINEKNQTEIYKEVIILGCTSIKKVLDS